MREKDVHKRPAASTDDEESGTGTIPPSKRVKLVDSIARNTSLPPATSTVTAKNCNGVPVQTGSEDLQVDTLTQALSEDDRDENTNWELFDYFTRSYSRNLHPSPLFEYDLEDVEGRQGKSFSASVIFWEKGELADRRDTDARLCGREETY